MSDGPRTLLYLHPSADLYGADRTLLDLVRGLDRARWTPLVALPCTGPLVSELEAAGATVVVGPLGVGARGDLGPRGLLRLAGELPRAVRFVRRLVREHDVALVHTNTMVVLGGALGARLSPARHLWHVHEILDRPRVLAALFARAFDRLADGVVWNSRATGRAFERHLPRLARRARVVWNGLDPERVGTPRRTPDEVRADLGLAAGTPLVGLVGRVNAWKGQGLLVRAVARLRARHPDLRVVLAGDCPPGQPGFGEDLDREIEAHDLADVVLRRPFTRDVGSLFGALDVAVVPSTRPEPFGLVALEAMAAGTPVVAANHGGVAEVVQHGRTGLRFEPNDEAALAEALEQLLDDPDRARRMGRAGRRRQRRAFGLDAHVRAIEAEYAALLGDPSPRAAALPAPVSPAPEVVHLVLGKANPARMNGVNAVVHHLATAQRAIGRAVEVWGLTADPDAPTPPRPYPLRLFGRARVRLRLTAELRAALRALPPTVLHLHGGLLPEWWAVARTAEAAGHRLVLSPHGAYRPDALRKRARRKRLYLSLFERALLRRVERVQAFTPAGAREIARLVPAERVVVLPNGVDLPPADRLAPVRRERGAPLVVFCGRLDAHTKGLDLLLEGLRLHQAAGGTCRMEWIGDGPARAGLERRRDELGLGPCLHLAGALFGEARDERLRRGQAFALVSRHEGMPVAALEAAALGLPLLVSEATRIADEVRGADAGWVLDALDPEAVARALDRVQALNREDALAEVGARARALAAERFPWTRIAAASFEVLYRNPAPGSKRGTEVPEPPAALPSASPPAERAPRRRTVAAADVPPDPAA